MDHLFDLVLPIFVVFGICLLMLAVSACTTNSVGTRSLDLAVKGSYNPGEASSTRNQNPQGGTDEKSDSTPIEPSR